MVVGVTGILAGLLLPALSRSKAAMQSANCKNNLRQVGIALHMYVGDCNRYPTMIGGDGVPGTFQIWADRLRPYSHLNWTNRSWHCPTYIARNGLVEYIKPPPDGGGPSSTRATPTTPSVLRVGVANQNSGWERYQSRLRMNPKCVPRVSSLLWPMRACLI